MNLALPLSLTFGLTAWFLKLPVPWNLWIEIATMQKTLNPRDPIVLHSHASKHVKLSLQHDCSLAAGSSGLQWKSLIHCLGSYGGLIVNPLWTHAMPQCNLAVRLHMFHDSVIHTKEVPHPECILLPAHATPPRTSRSGHVQP